MECREAIERSVGPRGGDGDGGPPPGQWTVWAAVEIEAVMEAHREASEEMVARSRSRLWL